MADKTGVVVAVGAAGMLLVWSGLNNRGVLATARDMIQGNAPIAGPKQSLVSSSSSGSSGTVTTQGDSLVLMSNASGAAQGAVGFCVAQVGKPYVWGATGPNGYDCSGLVYSGYKSQGVSIPRVSEMQMFYGTKIDVSQAIPGDLLFPEPGHVVMCIGGGQCVEAPHTGLDVRVRAYSPSEFVMCRRVA